MRKVCSKSDSLQKSWQWLSQSNWSRKGEVWSTWLLCSLNANSTAHSGWCLGTLGDKKVPYACWLWYSYHSHDSCRNLAVLLHRVVVLVVEYAAKKWMESTALPGVSEHQVFPIFLIQNLLPFAVSWYNTYYSALQSKETRVKWPQKIQLTDLFRRTGISF